MGHHANDEIVPELAPYIGVRWSRLHGGTRDLARIEDEPVDDTAFVVGLRAWW